MSTSELPSMRWLRSQLRHNVVARVRYKVLAAYVVGSIAKGTARPDSDLDIAVIIPSVRGQSALQITERYHARFMDERWKPRWSGRVADDPNLARYSKIPLPAR